MRLIFHGVLKDLVGSEVKMEGSSIADAVEGYSRQHPAWPRELRIAAVGYDTVDALLTAKPEEVHLMPALMGGGGKFGSIILGGVTFAVGAVLTFTGIAPQIGIPMMISGAMMMVQGVIGLFMKAPSMDKAENPEDSKYLGINRNTTAARTPITMAWGRVNLHPHWLSLQSDSNKLTHGRFPATTT